MIKAVHRQWRDVSLPCVHGATVARASVIVIQSFRPVRYFTRRRAGEWLPAALRFRYRDGMTDYAWVAPVATGVAAIVTASVAWRVATGQVQQLRLAIEMKDRIPAELEAEWDHFVYSSAAAVIRKSEKTVVPAFAAVAAWAFLVSAVIFDGNVWLLALTVASAVGGLFFSRAKARRVKKDKIERTVRLEKKVVELNATLAKERAASQQAGKVAMDLTDTIYKETMEGLFRAGAPGRVIVAFMHELFDETFLPEPGRPRAEDPRRSGAPLTLRWRARARWREIRGSSLNLDHRLVPETFPFDGDTLPVGLSVSVGHNADTSAPDGPQPPPAT